MALLTRDDILREFKEFVENVHGLHYRKATYWIEIYNRLSNSGVPWSKVNKIGWTKLKEIAKVLTKDNVDEWVKIASEQNTITLIDTVKNAMAKDAPKALEDQVSKAVTTMTSRSTKTRRPRSRARSTRPRRSPAPR